MEILAPSNLPFRLRLLAQLLTRRFQERMAPFDLTPLHWGILCCLWREDGLATQAVAQQLQQLGGTVTVGLDSMERRSLIRRRPDGKDKRVSRVWLTPRGRRLESRVVPPVRALVESMFSCFSPAEQDQFSKFVDRLHAHVEAEQSQAVRKERSA